MQQTPRLAGIGDRTRRKDGDLLVTGRAAFVDDLTPPDSRHAAVLRSPHPRARIRRVDAERARRAPGVLVVDGREAAAHIGPLPHFFDPSIVGGNSHDFPALAVDEVFYAGQPVVAAVAATQAEAEAALRLVDVDYEPLPFVLSVDEALDDGAPLVFESWGTNVVVSDTMGEGDPDRALAQADHVLSDTLDIQRFQTAPLEPRALCAWWQPEGSLELRCNTQMPHQLRGNLSLLFGLSEHRVRVTTPKVGGAFGHKFHGYPEEPLVCLLSRLCGKPVSWVESREEAMLVGAREFQHEFEVGCMADGRIVGLRSMVRANVGALGALGGWPTTLVSAMTLPGPYDIRATRCSYAVVATNKAPWNGARGYGKESAAVVMERMIEMVAQRLDLDPAEVRRRNFVRSDDFPHWTGEKRLDSGDYDGALRQSLDLAGYADLREAQGRARAEGRLVGVGLGFELTPEGGDWHGSLVRGFDTSTVRMDPSGEVVVLTGVTSPGTGNETAIAQVVAGELGLDVSAVSVVQGDTAATPYGFGNSSSRSLNLGGASALLAAREVKAKLATAAGHLWKIPVDEVDFRDGDVVASAPRTERMSMGDLAYAVYTAPMPAELMPPRLEATSTYAPANLDHDPTYSGGVTHTPYPTFPYSSHVAEVEVDPATGLVELRSYAGVDDCGTMVNPTFVEGQFQGAIAMGIGGALSEHCEYGEDGRLLTTTFKHYLPLRAVDLPTLKTGHQVTPSPVTLLGTKGAGEGGVGGALAAVTNAVNDALRPAGAVLRRLPARPPHVLAALREARR